MKTKLTLLLSFFILLSCSTKTSSEDFINKATGRYYFNDDEIIEVFFNNAELYLKWRNQEIKPLKVNDSTFYASELNEKLIFNNNKNRIELAKKREHHGKTYYFNKLDKNEKTPSEYLADNNFEKALEGYLAIKEKDSLSKIIRERNLNSLGYRYLRNDSVQKAIQVFTINTKLYPNSSNVFDSLGDAYLKAKDTTNAKENYKKALSINAENENAKRNLEDLTKSDK